MYPIHSRHPLSTYDSKAAERRTGNLMNIALNSNKSSMANHLPTPRSLNPSFSVTRCKSCSWNGSVGQSCLASHVLITIHVTGSLALNLRHPLSLTQLVRVKHWDRRNRSQHFWREIFFLSGGSTIESLGRGRGVKGPPVKKWVDQQLVHSKMSVMPYQN